jgi:hypothetical protein
VGALREVTRAAGAADVPRTLERSSVHAPGGIFPLDRAFPAEECVTGRP